MITYTPGDSVVHRLDPRSKLLFQFAFAFAAFVRPTVPRLVGLVALGAVCLWLAGTTVRRALRAYRVVLVVLAVGPLIAALSIGTPGLSADRALDSLRAIARVVPVLLVSAAYVHATPVRDTRAAVQRTVPGRAGQLLGTGIGLTFRYVPVVRADLRTVRDAVAARGGDERPFHERVARITTLVLARTLDRSDQLSVALQARCFAWNPTLPGLAFTRPDYPALGAAAVLIALPFVPL